MDMDEFIKETLRKAEELLTQLTIMEAAVAIMIEKHGPIEITLEQFQAIKADGLLVSTGNKLITLQLCSDAEAAMILAKEQFKGGLN